ncbi:MAG: DUF4349 domain-containing protein [Polyangiaceae bacterium]
MRRFGRVGLLLAVVTAVGCGGAASWDRKTSAEAPPPGAFYPAEQAGGYGVGADSDDGAKAPAAPPRDLPTTAQPGQTPANPTPNPTGTESSSRKPILIYTADFTMGVYEVEKSLNAVDGIAKDAGGYLSRRDDRSITVRIPAEKFNDVVAAIEKIGDVLSRNVVAEDVTAEYRDLEVQLQNQMALRERFEKLLEKAVKVEEALEIERELGRITGEIERVKGRLKLLSDLARYSTITVTFSPKVTAEVQNGPFVLPLPWLRDVGLRRLLSL